MAFASQFLLSKRKNLPGVGWRYVIDGRRGRGGGGWGENTTESNLHYPGWLTNHTRLFTYGS